MTVYEDLLEGEEPDDRPDIYALRIEPVATAALTVLSKGNKKLARQIAKKIRSLRKDPRPPLAIKLVNQDVWRLRMRDWRILYSIHDNILLVVLVDLAPRDKAYK